MINNLITGLFPELFLQWNRAMLSNRFLEKLAVSSEWHDTPATILFCKYSSLYLLGQVDGNGNGFGKIRDAHH
eukprot:2033406-Ditylum_brightwellii.AAC.1